MVKAGAMEGVDAVFGAHLNIPLRVGQIGVRSGPSSAAPDDFFLTVRGVGGHGALPHQGVDAIVIAAHVVIALQTIVSREVDALRPSVVTIGTVRGGYRENVLCDEVVMAGTVRTIDPDLREALPKRIEAIAKGVAQALRGECEMRFEASYPPLVNDPEMEAICRESATAVVGRENVIKVEPTMGGEDFAYFAREAPGMFFHIGGGNPDRGIIHPGHHQRYDFDEDAIPLGVAVMALSALNFLSSGHTC